MTTEIHKHEFKKVTKPVLLAKYKSEEGELKYIATVGKDLLKQMKCKCGKTSTYDLERVRL